MKHLLRRFLALTLALTILASLAVFPAAAEERFQDVSSGSWYSEAVEYVSTRGYMTGVGADSFAPNKNVTRAMFVQVLARISGAELDNSKTAFSDVPEGSWYAGAASWAYESGYVSGVGESRFAPMANITRQDLCTILAKYLCTAELDIPADNEITFTDEDQISGYAKKAVALCAKAGLIAGYSDGTFRPRAKATRAQAAVIIMRLDQLLQGLEVKPVPMPAQHFDSYAGSGMTVSVDAPAGALPEGSELSTHRVLDAGRLDVLTNVLRTNVLAAADISFSRNGSEIEPFSEVEVTITAQGLDKATNPAVVHLRDDGRIEPVADAELISVTRGGQKAFRFKASDFSVYAVIEDPQEDYAILTVNFYNDYVPSGSSTLIATMYVKNSDDEMTDEAGNPIIDPETGLQKHHVDVIVYDPGLGKNYQAASGDIFVGWSVNNQNFTAEAEGKTVDQIRKMIKDEYTTPNAIPEDGATLNLYAMIVKVYTVTYLDENNVSLGGSNVQYLRALATPENPHPAVEYIVNKAYIPGDPEQHFLGWKLREGTVTDMNGTAYNTETSIPNETHVLVRSNVVFGVNSPMGHWLVFHENGKGATYNAPVFLVGSDPTVRPATDPVRKGYDFGGWYEAELGADGKPQQDQDGNVILKSTPYAFGSAISTRVDVYAKWTAKSNASYTVVIWKQSVEGTDEEGNKLYDFGDSITINASPGTEITTVSGYNTGNDRYAQINGSNVRYTGFHLDTYDTEQEVMTVAPEGNTVVNVYYDRNEYTLQFQIQENGYYESTSTSSGYYYIPNDSGGYDQVYLYYNNGRWYRNRTGSYWSGYTYSNEYTGPRYSLGTYWSTIKTITALYEQNIADNFPVVGDNGVTYDNGERWDPQTNSVGWNEVMVFVPFMPAGNVNFHLDTDSRPIKTMYYYVEALPNATNTVTRNGVQYSLFTSQAAHYNGVTEEDFVALNGFTKLECAQTVTGAALSKNSDGFYIYSTTQNQSIYFFYSRNSYSIIFKDALCVDGEGLKITEEPDEGVYETKSNIPFESDITSYNKAGTNYVEPDREGFVLEGWYADSACLIPYTFTTMPLNGLTVYAKWRQIQYRTFLVPNAPDGVSIDWGNEDQEMNFRIDYGGAPSIPIAQDRNVKYEMVGWFLDEAAVNKPYNAGVFAVNDDNTVHYNKGDDPTDTTPIDYTDPMDKYGHIGANPYNSDYRTYVDNQGNTVNVDRFWITKKLVIYGKWRAILDGAEGINVEYVLDSAEAELFPDGQAADENDSTTYADQAIAIARSANHPIYTVQKDGAEVEMRFMHWKIMDWDDTEGKYVDSGLIAYPGGEYTIEERLARKQPVLDDDNQPTDRNTYTIRLVAVYDDNEQQIPTHITWYGNGGSVNEDLVASLEGVTAGDTYIDSDAEQINKPVAILPGETFLLEGHTFLGWARLREDDCIDDEGNFVLKSELTAADVWLQYHPATANRDGSGSAAYYTVNHDVDDTVPEGAHVSEIAADEHRPYNILYAVWTNDFYVYHSATGILEAVPMPADEDATVDLTSYVSEGTLYGGYYSACGGVLPQNVEAAKHEAILKSGSAARQAEVPGAVKYDAAAFTPVGLGDTTVGEFWSKQSAYGQFRVKVDGAFVTRKDPAGSEVTPVSGTVYYLKEVPSIFLQNHTYYVYNVAGGQITGGYLTSVVDDPYYKSVNFNLTLNGAQSVQTGMLASTFTYQRLNENQYDPHDPAYVTVTVQDAYPAVGKGGLLAVAPVPGEDPLKNVSSFSVSAAWTTLDGVTVTAVTETVTVPSTVGSAVLQQPAGAIESWTVVPADPASLEVMTGDLEILDTLELVLPTGSAILQ